MKVRSILHWTVLCSLFVLLRFPSNWVSDKSVSFLGESVRMIGFTVLSTRWCGEQAQHASRETRSLAILGWVGLGMGGISVPSP